MDRVKLKLRFPSEISNCQRAQSFCPKGFESTPTSSLSDIRRVAWQLKLSENGKSSHLQASLRSPGHELYHNICRLQISANISLSG